MSRIWSYRVEWTGLSLFIFPQFKVSDKGPVHNIEPELPCYRDRCDAIAFHVQSSWLESKKISRRRECVFS
jgi:hypothetical protein